MRDDKVIEAMARPASCPFCGRAAWIRSNRDWHRIEVQHAEGCWLEDYEPMWPATDEMRAEMIAQWNARAMIAAAPQPEEAP